jgi:phosphoribosylamine--glycine ligase
VRSINILVVGSGAREHTLAWKLSLSPKVKQIFCAPGNAGTAQLGQNLAIDATDIEGIIMATRKYKIDLTVIGPEAPLAAGLADQLNIRGLQVFGANKAAAMIESSKVFAKELMQKYKLPCARSASFTEYETAREYLRSQPLPVVVKADGLAAGKGVIIARTLEEAERALDDIMRARIFGEAGDKVLIEEFLTGREISAFIFTDAHKVLPIVPACDYKPIYDGNRGPNTGGMGSYSPPDFYTPELVQTVFSTIMEPTVEAMHEERRPYRGVLYGGLMLTENGLKILEFNARFGDPETQVILPRLKTDLVDIMLAVSDNRLEQVDIEWSEDACVGVVMASGGYPGKYRTGLPISGLNDVDPDVMVFHAGTRADDGSGEVLTSGGRVLTVVATGTTIEEAREKVYANITRISFEECYYRKDIAAVNG